MKTFLAPRQKDKGIKLLGRQISATRFCRKWASLFVKRDVIVLRKLTKRMQAVCKIYEHRGEIKNSYLGNCPDSPLPIVVFFP